MEQAGCESLLEAHLLQQLRDAGLPDPQPQYRFKRWRFDFAWPALRLAVEVQGGLWIQGRHNRAEGYRLDCVKSRMAQLAGWTLLPYAGDEVRDGSAARQLGMVIQARLARGER